MIGSLQEYLADPNLAFVLLAVGALAVLYEVATPGGLVLGTVGGILIVLGLLGLTGLPVTPPGLVLLAVAVVLLGAEVVAPATGIFATLGVLALLFAGLFLFQGAVAVSLVVLLPTVLVTGGGVVAAGWLASRVRNQPSSTGVDAMIGREAVVRSVDHDRALVTLDGVVWKARSPGHLEPGQRVSVIDVDGITLVVAPRQPIDDAGPSDRELA